MSLTLNARYPGRCRCGQSFERGARIVWGDGERRVVTECPSCRKPAPAPATGPAPRPTRPIQNYRPDELSPHGHVLYPALLARLSATPRQWHLTPSYNGWPDRHAIEYRETDDRGIPSYTADPLQVIADSVATPEHPLSHRDRDAFVPLPGALRQAIDDAVTQRPGHNPAIRADLMRACGLMPVSVPVRAAAE